MAKRKSKSRPAPRPQQASSARRLGAPEQQASLSAGARRRQQAAAKRSSNRVTFIAIGLVVLIVAVFVVIKLTSSTPPTTTKGGSSSGISSGQHPLAASIKDMVDPVTTIPLSVYNSVGVYGQQLPMTVTKGQTELTSGSLPRMVYVGAEYCPFCAMSRWAFVAALSRFGTFSGLKVTSSANDDLNIPTFSFLGSTYTSKYLAFTPYEQEDRNQNPLQTVPNDVENLYVKYDGNPSTEAPAVFNPGNPGIPFVDIANRFVSSGAPGFLQPVQDALEGGGPASTTVAAAAVIATAMHDPSTAEASALGSKYLIAFANYLTAGICLADGGKPSSVCNSAGVQDAIKQFKAAKPIA